MLHGHLWHHHDGLVSRLLHGLLRLHEGRHRCHADGLHLRLLLLLDHHGARRLLLLHEHLLLHHVLLLLHHDRLVVLGHGGLGVRLLRVRVLVGEHHALDAGRGCIRTVLEEHGGIGGARSDHEMLLLRRGLLQILLDGLLRDLFLGVGDLAEVGAPGGQAEAHKEVEDDDVRDEPPVEHGLILPALLSVLLDATPELELHEEHAPTDEEVEAKESFRTRFQALGKSYYL